MSDFVLKTLVDKRGQLLTEQSVGGLLSAARKEDSSILSCPAVAANRLLNAVYLLGG